MKSSISPKPAPAVTPPPPPASEEALEGNTIQPISANSQADKPVTIRPMWQIEREAIQQAIDYCDGNVLNAAVLLELSPSTVYRKKQAWEAEDEQQLV